MEAQGMERSMTLIIFGHHTSVKEPILVNPLLAHPHGSLRAGFGIKPAWIQRHLLLFVYSQVSGTFPLYWDT